jgi:hypothetical protein
LGEYSSSFGSKPVDASFIKRIKVLKTKFQNFSYKSNRDFKGVWEERGRGIRAFAKCEIIE